MVVRLVGDPSPDNSKTLLVHTDNLGYGDHMVNVIFGGMGTINFKLFLIAVNLSHSCDFAILFDLGCPYNCWNTDPKWEDKLKRFMRDKITKNSSEEDDKIAQKQNNNSVCRAAPGFAGVC